MSTKQLTSDIVAQVLLSEAAGEGPTGLAFVRDVIANRARQHGKSLEEIVLAPKQFSSASRPDLEEFYARQPLVLRNLAQQLVEEARHPAFIPHYPDIQHYVTQDLYQRRFEPEVAPWIREMEPVFTIGHHVALRPRSRR